MIGTIGTALQFTVPVLSARFIDVVIAKQAAHIGGRLSFLLAVSVGAIWVGVWEARLFSSIRERAALALQMKMFHKTQDMPHLRLLEYDSGHIASRLSADSAMALEILGPVCGLSKLLAAAIGGLIMLPRYSQTLGTCVIIALALHALVIIRLKKRTTLAFVKVSESTAAASKELYDSLTGLSTTKLFAAEARRKRRVYRSAVKRARSLLQARLLMIGASTAGQAIVLAISSGVTLWGSLYIVSGKLTLGGLVGLTTTLTCLLGPLNTGVQQVLGLQSAATGMRKVLEWIRSESESAPATPRPHSPGRARQAPRATARHGDLCLEDVTFSYPGRAPVLRSVNLNVSPGQVVLISGPSGSGKTTLVKLLPRLLRPTAGRIYFHGADLDDYDLRELRRQMAIVSQDTFLFSESIADNIRLGKPDATDSEVRRAAALANALEFIEQMPSGFQTMVGPHGAKLSGGQRQRIALARALLRPGGLLVLDEATTNLDQENEAAIYASLPSARQGKTTLIISHHWQRNYLPIDHHYVLERGQLQEHERISHIFPIEKAL
ncbi:MAG: ABC transporter ATP-binding protein [Acidobacteriaceae bacterium]|nr:ABC transporter ATP-binding protein [Acidobacteriaceae bacterium]